MHTKLLAFLAILFCCSYSAFSQSRFNLDEIVLSAENGRLITNSEFKFGVSIDEVEEILGQPKEIYNGEWFGYYDYGNYIIVFNDYFTAKETGKYHRDQNVLYTSIGVEYKLERESISGLNFIEKLGNDYKLLYQNESYLIRYFFEKYLIIAYLQRQNEIYNKETRQYKIPEIDTKLNINKIGIVILKK